MDKYNFPDALKELMLEHNTYPAVIARKTGLSKGYLSEVLAGRKNPGIDTLTKISLAIGVSFQTLLVRALTGIHPAKKELILSLLERVQAQVYWETGQEI